MIIPITKYIWFWDNEGLNYNYSDLASSIKIQVVNGITKTYKKVGDLTLDDSEATTGGTKVDSFPAEDAAPEMSVRIHTGEIARLTDVSSVHRMNRAGVAVLMFFREIRDQFPHDIQQIVLQIFQIKGVDIVRTLLHHHGAGRMMGYDADRPVLNAGSLHDRKDFF